MPDKTFKIIEVVGVSDDSIHQAVRNAIAKARKTIRNIDWFEVKDIRGSVSKKGDADLPGRSADRIPARRRTRGLRNELRDARRYCPGGLSGQLTQGGNARIFASTP